MTGERDGVCYGITAGVSMVPLPKIEQYYQEETWKFRRIELRFVWLCGGGADADVFFLVLSVSVSLAGD